jgi:hypothetical protein
MYVLVDHAKSSVDEYMRCASFCVEWAGELEYWSMIELIEVDASGMHQDLAHEAIAQIFKSRYVILAHASEGRRIFRQSSCR